MFISSPACGWLQRGLLWAAQNWTNVKENTFIPINLPVAVLRFYFSTCGRDFFDFLVFLSFLSLCWLIKLPKQPRRRFWLRFVADCFHRSKEMRWNKHEWRSWMAVGRKVCAIHFKLVCGIKLTVHIGDSSHDYHLASILMTTLVPDENANWERDAGERKATNWLVKTWRRKKIVGSNVLKFQFRHRLTLKVSCWLVVTRGKDFGNQMQLSTLKAYAMKLLSSPDSTSGRHIVWREMDTVLDALDLRKQQQKVYENLSSAPNYKLSRKSSQQRQRRTVFQQCT